jgi:metal-responsive CopG/Arc/MetJ family transcriptional regulator
MMRTAKVGVSLQKETLERLDRLVASRVFPSRSGAIQEAVEEKLARVGHTRLAEECEKLDMAAEQAMAEADFVEEGDA